jgi:siroheme synthase-like protein
MNSVAFEGNNLFPVFLKAEKLSILLVGAGPVGVEKATAILNNSPACRLVVVAEQVKEEFRWIQNKYPQVQIHQRPFMETDLEGIQVLFLAVNSKELSREIKAIANKKNLLVNVADTPDLCDFYMSSVVQKGDLKIAISTNGKSPTIAKRLREMLQELIPDDIQLLLENMTQIRAQLKGDFESKVKHLNEITTSFLFKKDE